MQLELDLLMRRMQDSISLGFGNDIPDIKLQEYNQILRLAILVRYN